MSENATKSSVQMDPVPTPTIRHPPRQHLSLKLFCHYFISNFVYLLLVPFLALTSLSLSKLTAGDLPALRDHLQSNVVSVLISSMLVVVLSMIYLMRRPRPVYLLNFSCYKPEDSRKVTREIFMERSALAGTFTKVQLHIYIYHISVPLNGNEQVLYFLLPGN